MTAGVVSCLRPVTTPRRARLTRVRDHQLVVATRQLAGRLRWPRRAAPQLRGIAIRTAAAGCAPVPAISPPAARPRWRSWLPSRLDVEHLDDFGDRPAVLQDQRVGVATQLVVG